MSRGGTSEVVGAIEAAGHRNEPRCLALSHNDQTLLSAADGDAKVWSLKTQQCVRTLPCGYGLSAIFVLSSRFVIIGTKEGELQAFCVATGDMVQEVAAHKGAVWSISLQPGAGSTTLLTASADKSIAVWQISELGSTEISIEMERSLDLGDDVMCSRFTPDSKYIAAGLLDASIRLLFFDTFKCVSWSRTIHRRPVSLPRRPGAARIPRILGRI